MLNIGVDFYRGRIRRFWSYTGVIQDYVYLFTDLLQNQNSLKAQKEMINGSTEITEIRHSDMTPVSVF